MRFVLALGLVVLGTICGGQDGPLKLGDKQLRDIEKYTSIVSDKSRRPYVYSSCAKAAASGGQTRAAMVLFDKFEETKPSGKELQRCWKEVGEELGKFVKAQIARGNYAEAATALEHWKDFSVIKQEVVAAVLTECQLSNKSLVYLEQQINDERLRAKITPIVIYQLIRTKDKQRFSSYMRYHKKNRGLPAWAVHQSAMKKDVNAVSAAAGEGGADNQSTLLRCASRTMAFFGHTEAVESLGTKHQDAFDSIRAGAAEGLCDAGKQKEAGEWMKKIQSPELRDNVCRALSRSLYRQKKYRDALGYAAMKNGDDRVGKALLALLCKSKKWDMASDLLTKTGKWDEWGAILLDAMAQARELGRVRSALTENEIQLTKETAEKIARAFIVKKDIAGANETLGSLKNEKQRTLFRHALAVELARAGQTSKAMKLINEKQADTLSDARGMVYALKLIQSGLRDIPELNRRERFHFNIALIRELGKEGRFKDILKIHKKMSGWNGFTDGEDPVLFMEVSKKYSAKSALAQIKTWPKGTSDVWDLNTHLARAYVFGGRIDWAMDIGLDSKYSYVHDKNVETVLKAIEDAVKVK